MRHLLRDDDLAPAEQEEVLTLAAELKAHPFSDRCLAGPQTVAVLFDKPTLRTQASFASGIAELGGYSMLVDGNLARVGERESVADVARVLGRQSTMIVWRTFAQTRLEQMAAHAGVPVVNALTDDFHPCQLLADLLTVSERRGRLSGLTVTFLGDAGCNMAHSWLLAGASAGMHVRLTGPVTHQPAPTVLADAESIARQTGGSIAVVTEPHDAVAGADVLVTDTWVSMGKESESADRAVERFAAWQLDQAKVERADDPVVLHCLPAYRGREITAEVLQGPHSAVWDEAENRRHVQKALISWLRRQQDGRGQESPEGGS